jgi:hypothetical protein
MCERRRTELVTRAFVVTRPDDAWIFGSFSRLLTAWSKVKKKHADVANEWHCPLPTWAGTSAASLTVRTPTSSESSKIPMELRRPLKSSRRHFLLEPPTDLIPSQRPQNSCGSSPKTAPRPCGPRLGPGLKLLGAWSHTVRKDIPTRTLGGKRMPTAPRFGIIFVKKRSFLALLPIGPHLKPALGDFGVGYFRAKKELTKYRRTRVSRKPVPSNESRC